MLDFPKEYKIVRIWDKTGVITSNHKTKELIISKDIELKKTDDGKLCAIFPNFKKDNKSSKRNTVTDCSIIISDPSCFNHCIQKDGAYQLSGSKVTFNGTDNNDSLILNGCENSKINMKAGDDIVLYREKNIFNNNINLGDGDNIFTPAYKTDADRSLINNKISSGKGQDYIHLRNAIGNEINSGDGNDSITIEGAPQTRFANIFRNNLITTGSGDDKIDILGNFDKFYNNSFYLGKGSDSFSAKINPDNDAKTESDYNNKLYEYINSVSNNKIYAIDGKKGWFEKNIFETKTYSANQLSEYISAKAVSEGFQKYNTKPVPINQTIVPGEKETIQSSQETTLEKCKKRYQLGSLGYNLFHDPKMQEAAFKALDDYVNSMLR